MGRPSQVARMRPIGLERSITGSQHAAGASGYIQRIGQVTVGVINTLFISESYFWSRLISILNIYNNFRLIIKRNTREEEEAAW